MNPIYLCGPHGAGKTTLAHRLRDACPAVLLADLKTSTPKFHTTPFERIMLKAAQRAIENYETQEIAATNPDRIVIGNRCIYDARAYADAFRNIGWITEQQYDRLRTIECEIFMIQEPYAIILNPGYDVIEKRLANRWTTEQKKWRESDTAYVRAARDAYVQFKDGARIHYIGHNDIDGDLLAALRAMAEATPRQS